MILRAENKDWTSHFTHYFKDISLGLEHMDFGLNRVTLGKMRGEIELKNVTFGYDATKPVLKDITFKVPAGEMLGIVGRSGAGKSTLVNLITRLYDPQEGSIYIDGVNVKDMSFAELRKNVAMVSQETYIFMGTVAENIAYARPDATRE